MRSLKYIREITQIMSLYVRIFEGYLISSHFDAEWYLSTNPDLAKDGASPKRHFMRQGWKEGRDPSSDFSVKSYLEKNPDVTEQNFNPLTHYVRYGKAEGRNSYPSIFRKLVQGKQTYSGLIGSDDFEVHPDLAAIFDEVYYTKNNEDVRRRNVNPIEHFVTVGIFEHRDPNPHFSFDFYLKQYPDVAASGVNALLHYLFIGHTKDHDPSKLFSNGYYKELFPDVSRCPLVDFYRREDRNELLVLPDLENYTTRHLNYHEQVWLAKQDDLLVDIDSNKSVETSDLKKAIIHVHAYLLDDVIEFLHLLKNEIRNEVDVLLSVCNESAKLVLDEMLDFIGEHSVKVVVVPNRGRDLGPLFTNLKWIFERYDYVCHVHMKKSPHINFGDSWRRYLLNGCIGSLDRIRSVIAHFEKNQDCGILYPENYREIRPFTTFVPDKDSLTAFLRRIDPKWQCEEINFPAGSMCWMRSACYKPYLSRFPEFSEYEAEEGQLEGTLAHLLERCLSLIPVLSGYDQSTFPANEDNHLPERTVYPHDRWMRDTAKITINTGRDLVASTDKFNKSSLNIHWIIPDFAKGAGGHQTIFRMVKYLEEFGHRQTIWLQNGDTQVPPAERLSDIQAWYQLIENVHVLHLPADVSAISGDVVIATDCWTAYPARQMSKFKERFYFIQDYEPYFHAMGELYLVAEQTYSFGFSALCAGKWLHEKALETGMWSAQWDLSNDSAIYKPRPSSDCGRQNGPIKIAFYARRYTPRRAVELGLVALEILSSRDFDFEVLLFGEDDLDISEYSFNHQQIGIVSPEKLAELYCGSDVGLVFSTTNYSLVPLEMMGCDLPVIEVDVESTRAAFPQDTVEFAKPNPTDIADTIERLCCDKPRRDLLIENGRSFVQNVSWEKSAKKIETALLTRLEEKGFEGFDFEEFPAPTVASDQPLATVVIPTYNAIGELEPVLIKVMGQDVPWKYDVLVIDSSSTDGTEELVKSYPNVRFHSIPQEDFQHGGTRNLGIEMSRGDFTAFLTQDAEPLDNSWLRALIAGFEMGPKIGGVTGRHQSRPEHGLFLHRDMEAMFDGLGRMNSVNSWATTPEESLVKGTIDWLRITAFYSDNNSAIRRSVWKQLPYPNIDWGEDLVWCLELIGGGLQKAYVDEAVVLHSHAYDPRKSRSVAKHEGKLFKTHIGVSFSDSVQNMIDQVRNRLIDETNYAKVHNIPDAELDLRESQIVTEVVGRSCQLWEPS